MSTGNLSLANVAEDAKRQFTDRQRLLYGLLGLLLSCFITLVNSAVLAVFLRRPEPRRVPGHALIVGLMVTSDIMIGATALPGYLVDTLFDAWPLPLWLCDLWITCDYTSTNVSVASVTAVAFDRFLATNCVFAHKRWMHRANQVRLCVALWLITAARNVATFPVWVAVTGFRSRSNDSQPVRCSHPIYRNPTAALVQRTLALYIPIILLVFFYAAVVVQILRSARAAGQGAGRSDTLLRAGRGGSRSATSSAARSHKGASAQKSGEARPAPSAASGGRLAKSFRIVTCVLVSFLLANLPWHVLDNMIMMQRTRIRKTDSVYILSWVMCYMNAFLNPFFYLFMNDNYKRALLDSARCRFVPGRRPVTIATVNLPPARPQGSVPGGSAAPAVMRVTQLISSV